MKKKNETGKIKCVNNSEHVEIKILGENICRNIRKNITNIKIAIVEVWHLLPVLYSFFVSF